ncbi:pyridoxal phosphate-dependent aminotransferase [Robiginitalea sp. SC105]|uniref:pyridoxal phosphate-dependent aminotransferase n=1 Tax=Robiginitalea sp. SC105 TaxID=2762332 RepID=UPI001639757A|nr:pyridoxal phosphate-dependent aminotransferase [Robiginitalea sp. SC105]MBC2839080.1 pyridoxal phosphate-dependent aminotransferase [Robiginitalea sp. SC105]
MPTLSKKGQAMPASPIRKLVPYAEAAKKSGVEVIHLNIGQPDIKTPPQALEAVRNFHIDVLEYSRSEGNESYRAKLAEYYRKVGIDVGKEEILVTTGGSEALSFVMNCVADLGDEIIIPEPFYANYNGFATATGVTVVPIASGIENNFALPPIADFESYIGPRTRAILLCNPGNPTGYLYSREEIRSLAELVRRHDLFLIADEVYREFAYDGAEHYSILQEEGLREHAVVVDSVSKRYSMCGARIGCIITRNAALMQTALKFAQARLSPPTFAQVASEAALDTPPSYFEGVIAEYTRRRDLLVEELRKIPGIIVARPRGAFYCMVELPIRDADHFAQWLLEDFRLDGATVMLAPAAGFYATPGLGENQVRIAYVLEEKLLRKAVNILRAALEKYREDGY